MTPEVTVMMPVYNARPYVRAAVASVLSQTFANLKLLIVDDGSDDGCAELLQELASTDARIELIRRGRMGQVETRNELLQRAQTELVACADADDISLPTRLADQLAVMKRDSDLVVLGTQLRIMDVNGHVRGHMPRQTGAHNVRKALLRGAAISQPSSMLRRTAIIAAGGYRKCYEHAEDYDMLLRAAEMGKVDNAEGVGIHYRVHQQSVSHRHAIRQMASADLARATHALRIAGEGDPTSDLQDVPAYDHPVMKALVPSAALYALLETVRSRPEEVPLQELLSTAINRRQQRHVQRALIDAVRQREFDALSARALLRAVALGPGRFIRSYRTRPDSREEAVVGAQAPHRPLDKITSTQAH